MTGFSLGFPLDLSLQKLGFDDEDFHSVTGNATLRRVSEAYFQGQPSLTSGSAPTFLSPENAAIIGVVGAPIYLLVGMTGGFIWKILSGDDGYFEDDSDYDDDDRFLARALRKAATWPLFSLVLGVTAAAMILRLRDPSISVGYSALCGWVGLLVLFFPIVVFDEFHRFLVLEVLTPTYTFVAERFIDHFWKGCDLWNDLVILFSLVIGITAAAMILRLKDPSISVGYSALCGWVGVLVLFFPIVVFDEFHRFLVLDSEVLTPTYTFVAERFIDHFWKGCDLWNDSAAEGEIVL